MEVLEEWQIAAIAILTVVVALLLGVLMVGVCLCLRKRELLCFKVRKRRRDYSDNDYSYINESHDNLRHRKRFMHQKDTRKHTAPIQDPFSKRFSEIPMDYDEDLNWDNPLFDRTKDAAITIQSWWRMARYLYAYTLHTSNRHFCAPIMQDTYTLSSNEGRSNIVSGLQRLH